MSNENCHAQRNAVLMKFTMPTRSLAIAVAAVTVLTACSGVRLQKPYETANELSKSSQARFEADCDAYNGPQAMDCKRRVKEEFNALRKKNEDQLQ